MCESLPGVESKASFAAAVASFGWGVGGSAMAVGGEPILRGICVTEGYAIFAGGLCLPGVRDQARQDVAGEMLVLYRQSCISIVIAEEQV